MLGLCSARETLLKMAACNTLTRCSADFALSQAATPAAATQAIQLCISCVALTSAMAQLYLTCTCYAGQPCNGCLLTTGYKHPARPQTQQSGHTHDQLCQLDQAKQGVSVTMEEVSRQSKQYSSSR